MDNLVHFTPKKAQTAAGNLDKFINHCRGNLAAFGRHWETNTWKTVNDDRTVSVTFSKLSQPKGETALMMDTLFLDFAKAYIKYVYSVKPIKTMANQILALRVLEAAFVVA
ncbi:hypothetical protein [Shewanella sp. TC10]|uniref:hypothetical protein n=1 Tax=Shewanella sp. TC10 TaxID=1419739 RepID=UPI00129E515C|nr:hypothetical protein [Shewanella sp. TC10]